MSFDIILSSLFTLLNFQTLLILVVGVMLGSVAGVLPGVGPTTTIALLLPISFVLNSHDALVLLAAVYYGTQYGGSTSSILLNLPGEASSVVTCIDGYKLTKMGMAGKALHVAALSSLIAGLSTIIFMILIGSWIEYLYMYFTQAFFTTLSFVGMILFILVLNKEVNKNIISMCIGGLIGIIGVDQISGSDRLTFGLDALVNGVGIVLIVTGFFSLVEFVKTSYAFHKTNFNTVPLTRKEIKEALPSIGRGTLIGAIIGLIPGAGAILSSIAAYSYEAKIDKKVGTGSLNGVAAPEAANNAASQTGFIPLLVLGLPENQIFAMILAVLMFHGVVPGTSDTAIATPLAWVFLWSLLFGNVLLYIINFKFVKTLSYALNVSSEFLLGLILVFSVFSILHVSKDPIDLLLLVGAFLIGTTMWKVNLSAIPLIVGSTLIPIFEDRLTRTLTLSQGNFTVFLTDPASVALMLIALLIWFVKTKTYD